MSRSKPEAIAAFWHTYLAALPDEAPRPMFMPEAWHFCDNAADADELADLVLVGVKRATASLQWAYAGENDPLPQVGDLSIITNWDGDPLCIIVTTEVTITPFNAVSAEFAAAEGEGDRSLAYWRKVHWDFFSEECAEIGRGPAEDMPVICERFKVVYPTPDA